MASKPRSSSPLDQPEPIPDNEFVERLTRKEVRKFLAQETLFRGSSAAILDRLADMAVQRLVPKDHLLYSMGNPCQELHFVVEGCGLLVKTAPDGRQRIVHRALAGEMVGCAPFFDRKGYPATFVAESECVVVSLPRKDLMALLSTHPEACLSIVGGLAQRLRMMEALVAQMSFEDTAHRLWDFLYERSENCGCRKFPRALEPIPTRERIANAIGTVREVVSRRLSALVDSGHIRIEGRRMVLLKPLE